MTYRGGIEDGKAALATQILNIVNDDSKTDVMVLDEIIRLCNSLTKKPNAPTIREKFWNDGPEPVISAWSPTPDEL